MQTLKEGLVSVSFRNRLSSLDGNYCYGNPNNAYEVGAIVAKESRAAGVQWNLSPVVDVNNNPLNPIINTRSFSENPGIVSEYAAQYIRGLQENGMISTAKHFPGHGDTQTDSHSS